MQPIKTLLRRLFLVSVTVLMASAAFSQYCTPLASNCTLDDEILNVTFGTLNNSSSGCSGSGYTSYVSLPAPSFAAGNSFPISVTIGPGGNDRVAAWIDYNQNSTFEASEFTLIGTTPGGTVSSTIAIPASALAGNTRMRIRVRYSTAITGADACTTFSFGETEDYTVNIIAAPGCTGTPAPGNTLASANPVCLGANFTLSLQNSITGSGVTYQWQSATAVGGPWNNITGATNSTLTTTQTAATFYRCLVTCSSNTGTSTPLQVTMDAPTNCYCAAGANTTSGEKISRVRYIQIDNSSTSTAGYENFTTVSTPAFAGGTTPITVNIAGGFPADRVIVWIDFNQNGLFTDAGELVYTSTNGVGPHTGNITIPLTALAGNTRMRIRLHDTSLGPNSTPCGNSSWGQVEDYTVNIQPCVATAFSAPPASASITCGNNATFSVTATGSLPTYSWQYRTSPSAVWNDITDGGVFSGATTATLTLTNVPASFSGNQFRALLRGACSAVDFSSVATLTVSQPVPVVTPSSATLCNGAIQALSLTNTSSNTDLFSESFNNIPGLIAAGWATTNLSSPLGVLTGWIQGITSAFPAYSGAGNSYLAANYQSTGSLGTISNWLLTPTVAIKNGDQLKFWTRTLSGLFPDRLEIRMSANGNSANVGTTATSVGDFTTLLLTVNPSLTTTGYPTTWTQYTATVSGLSAPATGRFAFRYFVTGGGSTGANSDYIGVDDVVFTSVGSLVQGVWTASPAAPNSMFTDAAATIPYTGSPATTIFVRPSANTSYSVSYSTSTPCQSSVTTVPVTVSNPVTGLAVAPLTRAVCLGGNTTFTASVTNVGAVTYQWERSIDGGLTYSAISGATSATLAVNGVTQNMTGYRYRVVATAAPCGSVTSNVATLTVNPLPVVTISSPVVRLVPGRTTTITATSTPAAAPNGWSWTYNGNPISGTTNTQVVNIDRLGGYQATVVDVNGCVNKSNELVISAEPTDKLWIYPNPTVNGAFQVRLYFSGDLSEKRVVTIYNPLGQVIESRDFTLVRGSAPYQRMDFNLGGGATAKGSYVVKVANLYTGKVVSGIILVQ